MTEHEKTEGESDGLVIALSPRQLACVVAFIFFVVILTRARRRAGH